MDSPGLTTRQVADYWAVHRYTGPKHGNYEHQEGFSDALDGMIIGNANSLLVFRQLMDAARTSDERAELLTGYLRNIPWKDDPDFAFWLRSIETSSPADAETFALIRRYSENAELPYKSVVHRPRKKGPRWPKDDATGVEDS
ncbi:hypothetical protein ACX8Z9_14415 [Arthrobacter halodurans]|uniref:Uncharacterized protein n=1 Tax=Arthrobacter halodurans TaxID=516699 RepID=A0ABV4UMB9_9MICC